MQRLSHARYIKKFLLKFSFSKAVVSYLDENRGENPQHSDLEDSDIHRGGVDLQTVQQSTNCRKRKMLFHLVLES